MANVNIVLIEAPFNKFLTDALAMESQQQGIKISEIINGTTDKAATYRPSVIPCVMAVRECGCKCYEEGDPLSLSEFGRGVTSALESSCACVRRKSEAIRARLRDLIADRQLEIALGGQPDALARIDDDFEALRGELAKLEGQ